MPAGSISNFVVNQTRAIRKIAERFEDDRQRKALLVMATVLRWFDRQPMPSRCICPRLPR
jgi:hypothetical protein